MNRTIATAMTTAAPIIGAAVSSPAAQAAEPKPAPFGKTNQAVKAHHAPVTALNPQVAV